MTDTTKPPETLYHYCGVGGFHGIIESKEFWLTDARFMNDYMEHRWFTDRVSERIQAMLHGGERDLIEPLAKLFPLKCNPYLCCFSSVGDLLSQWRAYADDGTGFAIGFSRDALREMISTRGEGIWLNMGEVEYSIATQDKMLDALFDNYIERHASDDHVVLDTICDIWDCAARYKCPGFAEEKEWRIVLMFRRDPILLPMDEIIGPCRFISRMKFRVSANRIVPYLLMPFPPDMVTEIRLGPKNYARENHDFVRLFLKERGYSVGEIKIINSAATYR